MTELTCTKAKSKRFVLYLDLRFIRKTINPCF